MSEREASINFWGCTKRLLVGTSVALFARAMFVRSNGSLQLNLDPDSKYVRVWAPEGNAVAYVGYEKYSDISLDHPYEIKILKSDGTVISVPIASGLTVDDVHWQKGNFVVDEHYMSNQIDSDGYDNFGEHGGAQQVTDPVEEPVTKVISVLTTP